MTRTFDCRLNWRGQSLALLVEAETHQQAREFAPGQAANAGYDDAIVEWVVEHPRHRALRPRFAITDER